MDISELRIRIDEVDEQILKLLNRRAGYALKIGHIKRVAGMEVYVPERERQVLAHVQDENLGPLGDSAVKRLFERIIDESRRLEQEQVSEEKRRLASGRLCTMMGRRRMRRRAVRTLTKSRIREYRR